MQRQPRNRDCLEFIPISKDSIVLSLLLELPRLVAADEIAKLRMDAILIVVAFVKQLLGPLAEDRLGLSLLEHEETIRVIENGSHQR